MHDVSAGVDEQGGVGGLAEVRGAAGRARRARARRAAAARARAAAAARGRAGPGTPGLS